MDALLLDQQLCVFSGFFVEESVKITLCPGTELTNFTDIFACASVLVIFTSTFLITELSCLCPYVEHDDLSLLTSEKLLVNNNN